MLRIFFSDLRQHVRVVIKPSLNTWYSSISRRSAATKGIGGTDFSNLLFKPPKVHSCKMIISMPERYKKDKHIWQESENLEEDSQVDWVKGHKFPGEYSPMNGLSNSEDLQDERMLLDYEGESMERIKSEKAEKLKEDEAGNSNMNEGVEEYLIDNTQYMQSEDMNTHSDSPDKDVETRENELTIDDGMLNALRKNSFHDLKTYDDVGFESVQETNVDENRPLLEDDANEYVNPHRTNNKSTEIAEGQEVREMLLSSIALGTLQSSEPIALEERTTDSENEKLEDNDDQIHKQSKFIKSLGTNTYVSKSFIRAALKEALKKLEEGDKSVTARIIFSPPQIANRNYSSDASKAN